MGLFDGARLVALDTETTGFDPEPAETPGSDPRPGDRIVEVACVPIDDGRIGEPWSALVDPGRPIPFGAEQVHGITNDMVRGRPRATEIAVTLEARCAGRILVLHNAAFDVPFLRKDFRLPLFDGLLVPTDLPLFGPRLIDTLGLARGLFGVGGNGLGDLARRLRVAPGTAHRAAGDALTTARLLLALGERWERERGVRTLDELAAESRRGLLLAGRRPRG
jgi:DNA polymerase-3 subunit epsilon